MRRGSVQTYLKPLTLLTGQKLCTAKAVTKVKSYNKNSCSPAEALAQEDEPCYQAEVS